MRLSDNLNLNDINEKTLFFSSSFFVLPREARRRGRSRSNRRSTRNNTSTTPPRYIPVDNEEYQQFLLSRSPAPGAPLATRNTRAVLTGGESTGSAPLDSSDALATSRDPPQHSVIVETVPTNEAGTTEVTNSVATHSKSDYDDDASSSSSSSPSSSSSSSSSSSGSGRRMEQPEDDRQWLAGWSWRGTNSSRH